MTTSENSDKTKPSISRYTSEYKLASYTSFLGALAILLMIIGSFFFDNKALKINTIKSAISIKTTLFNHPRGVIFFTTLDTFFIIGYSGMFIGLFLITRDINPLFSQFGFGFAIITIVGDIFENALTITLAILVSNQWNVNTFFFVLLWIFGFFIDMTSYIASFSFGIILISNFNPNSRKVIIGALLLLYTLIGLLSFIFPLLQFVRILFFLIGLIIVGFTLRSEPDIDITDLLKLEQEHSKVDYA